MNNFKISLPLCAVFGVLVASGCGSPTPATAPEATTPNAKPAAVATNSAKPATGDKPVAGTKPVPTATLMNARDMKPDTKNYRVRGVVKSIEDSIPDGRMTLNISHEDIPGFMQAMEMRVPFAKNEDAKKVKVGDKIAFDMNRSTLDVSNIEQLPPATQLKLR